MSQPQGTQAVAMLAQAGFSPEQIRDMFRAVIPDIQRITSSETLLEELAHRLAANGLTSDLAQHWAARVEAAFDGHPAARDVVADLVPQLFAGSVTAAEGARYARSLYAVLDEIRRVPADVIDTTAVTVPDRPSPVPSWS